MKTILLTNGHPIALSILRELHQQGFQPHSILVESLPSPLSGMRYPKPQKLSLRSLVRSIRRWQSQRDAVQRFREQCHQFQVPIQLAGPINSKTMQSAIQREGPDYVLLGGMGLLSAQTIKLARHGVLNSHPGLLPWARNVGVVGCSLLRGIPVGCTVHFVDPGIDTGRIIQRRLLKIEESCSTVAELEAAADLLCAKTLASVVSETIGRGDHPMATAQTEKHKPCKWLTAEQRAAADRIVASGDAIRIAESWSEYCVDSDTLILRPDAAPMVISR